MAYYTIYPQAHRYTFRCHLHTRCLLRLISSCLTSNLVNMHTQLLSSKTLPKPAPRDLMLRAPLLVPCFVWSSTPIPQKLLDSIACNKSLVPTAEVQKLRLKMPLESIGPQLSATNVLSKRINTVHPNTWLLHLHVSLCVCVCAQKHTFKYVPLEDIFRPSPQSHTSRLADLLCYQWTQRGQHHCFEPWKVLAQFAFKRQRTHTHYNGIFSNVAEDNMILYDVNVI